MRKLRALFCVALCCIIFSTTCGVTFASGILIGDLSIDPWGDLEDVENYEPPEPTDPTFSDPYYNPDEIINSEGVEEGGVALFSLNDNSYSRNIYFSSSFNVGNSNTNGLVTYAAGIRTFTYNPTSTSYAYTPDSSYKSASVSSSGVRLIIPKGMYAEISANVYYSPDDVEKIIVAGGGTFYMQGYNGYNQKTSNAYPATAQLVVNGELVGEPVEMSNGVFSFSSVNIPVTQEITTLGYRFTYSSAVNNVNTSATSATSFNYRIYFEDNALFTIEEVEDEPAYNGLLDAIIGWLRNIWEGIKNIGQSILDGLKGLFVPEQSDITEIKDMYNTLLQERLGAVYDVFSWFTEFANDLINAFKSGNEYSFTFPGISFPMNGEMVTILEETTVDMDNDVMDILRGVLGTIVSLVCVVAFVNTASEMVIAIISGTSYFDFLKAKKGGGGE